MAHRDPIIWPLIAASILALTCTAPSQDGILLYHNYIRLRIQKTTLVRGEQELIIGASERGLVGCLMCGTLFISRVSGGLRPLGVNGH